MFDQNLLNFIKRVMTNKALDEVKEHKTMNIDIERAIQIVEKIDSDSKLRESVKKILIKNSIKAV